MVRTYLRYDSAHAGGLLLSPHCNAIHSVHIDGILPNIAKTPSSQVFLTAAARSLQFVGIDTGELIHAVPVAPEGDVKDTGHITVFQPSADARTLFVGMSTGRVSVFQYETEEGDYIEQCTAFAHRQNTKITVLHTNELPGKSSERFLLASGGQDTSIVIWDVFAREAVARLEGHKGPLIGLHFMHSAQFAQGDYLLSASEDGLLKLWDIENAHCVHTIVASETASFLTASAYAPSLGVVLLAAKDGFLRAYAVQSDFSPVEDSPGPSAEAHSFLYPLQDIPRRDSRGIQSIATVSWSEAKDSQTTAFLCASKERAIEVFSRVTSAKRGKKAKKRAAAEGAPASGIFYSGTLYAATSKIAGIAVFSRQERLRTPILDIAIGLRNNSVQTVANLPGQLVTAKPDARPSPKGAHTLAPGHAGEVSSVFLNTAATALVTASAADGIRRWHFQVTDGRLRISPNGSVSCPNITATVLLPDDSTVLCGTTAGELLRVNLRSMEVQQRVLVDKILGGKAKVTAMCVGGVSRLNDKARCVVYACGADSTLRAYSLESPFEVPETPTRTLELPDVATAVTCCPEDKLLAVALHDTSIRLHFIDSFKQYLKLYGHAYPALSVSISSDATMLVSGGMDKSIKIWGLDFGDLHRSIKAHEEYITGVGFLPGTHHVASVSRDGTAKLWDGDHWDLIQELYRGTSSQVSSLCVARDAASIVTADADGFIKAFERTEETLFLTEEIEKRMERQVDRDVEERAMFETRKRLTGAVTSRTVSAVAASDALRERIDRMVHDKLHAPDDETEDVGRQRQLRLWRFLSRELRSIDMHHALAGLSFDVASQVLRYLLEITEKGWMDDVERCASVVSVLGRIHHRNLPGGLLGALAGRLRVDVLEEKRRVGHNLAGLTFVQQRAVKRGGGAV